MYFWAMSVRLGLGALGARATATATADDTEAGRRFDNAGRRFGSLATGPPHRARGRGPPQFNEPAGPGDHSVKPAGRSA